MAATNDLILEFLLWIHCWAAEILISQNVNLAYSNYLFFPDQQSKT